MELPSRHLLFHICKLDTATNDNNYACTVKKYRRCTATAMMALPYRTLVFTLCKATRDKNSASSAQDCSLSTAIIYFISVSTLQKYCMSTTAGDDSSTSFYRSAHYAHLDRGFGLACTQDSFFTCSAYSLVETLWFFGLRWFLFSFFVRGCWRATSRSRCGL